MQNYWLVKTEPGAYSWADLCRDGKTVWDGVRNYQARNYLNQMKQGDQVLVYHSVTEKRIVGIAEIVREAFPDPSDEKWISVELVPIETLLNPVPLTWIKEQPALADLPLLKQSRLSVMPITYQHFYMLINYGKNLTLI